MKGPPCLFILMTPPLSIGIDVNSPVKPVRQLFGTVFAIIILLVTAFMVFFHFCCLVNEKKMMTVFIQSIACTAASFYLYFFSRMLLCPEFISGSPDFKTFLAPLANLLMNFIRIFCVIRWQNIPLTIYNPQSDILTEIVLFLFVLLAYGQRDDMKSCCLCFKPWVIPTKTTALIEENDCQYPTVPFTYPGYNDNDKQVIYTSTATVL